MDEASTFGSSRSGGLNSRLQQRAERGAIDPDSLPFDTSGAACQSCGAHNPMGAVACLVCGSDLSGPIAYQVIGNAMPALEITLEPGQSIYAETGALGWMTESIEMRTVMAGSPWALLGRSLSGMTALVAEFAATTESGLVALTARLPGKIVGLEVRPDRGYILQNGAFLAAQRSVTLNPHFQQNLGAVFFGGEGFVLQSVRGSGMVFAQIDGEVAQYELAAGQVLLADPGSVGIFESSVSFGLRRVKGISNVLFNEGLFLAELRGPGTVWLQTMPFARLFATFNAHLAKDGAGKRLGNAVAGTAATAVVAGSMLGGLGKAIESLTGDA